MTVYEYTGKRIHKAKQQKPNTPTNRYLSQVTCPKCYDHLFAHSIEINEMANKLSTPTITPEMLIVTYLNQTHGDENHGG